MRFPIYGYTYQSTNTQNNSQIINAENQYQMCREPKAIESDISNFFFDASNVPQENAYATFVANVSDADKIFMRISTLSKDRLLYYKEALTNSALSRAKTYTNQ